MSASGWDGVSEGANAVKIGNREGRVELWAVALAAVVKLWLG